MRFIDTSVAGGGVATEKKPRTVAQQLEAVGAQLWSPEAVNAHKREFERKFETSRRRLLRILFSTRKTWRTNILSVPAGTYARDGVRFGIPISAQELVARIRKPFPRATFHVTFYGTDPLLICVPEPLANPKDKYTVMVWDEADNKQVVIPPPAV